MARQKFENAVYHLFDKNEKILVLVRKPNSGNNRYFFFINKSLDFGKLMNESKPFDSITVFKTINTLKTGLVTARFIENCLESINEKSFEFELVALCDSYEEYSKKGWADWKGIESASELKELLVKYLGRTVTLLADPDFCDEENTFHLYYPDKYGVSKPGRSY